MSGPAGTRHRRLPVQRLLPGARAAWDAAIAVQGIPLKVRRDPDDSFAEPEVMVARMDELGIDTLVVVAGDPSTAHGAPPSTDRDRPLGGGRRAGPPAPRALRRPVGDRPRRWAWPGVRRAEEALAQPLGGRASTSTPTASTGASTTPTTTPSTPCATAPGVPVVMQAGTSGGLMPSEAGQPIGIDRAAIYFPDTAFVLSHTGWPWVDEAVAMALKFPNVYLGTASYPPRHWPPAVVDFLRQAGRNKVLFGTNFPTVGHRHALDQLDELELDDAVRHGAARGQRPRASSPGCDPAGPAKEVPPMIGKVYAIPPQPVDAREHPLVRGRQRHHRGRVPRPRSRGAGRDLPGQPRPPGRAARARSPEGGFTDEGVSLHVAGTDGRPRVRALRRLRRRAPLPLQPPAVAEIVNNVIDFDTVAHGDMLPWALERIRTRLPEMLAEAGGAHLVPHLDPGTVDAVVAT